MIKNVLLEEAQSLLLNLAIPTGECVVPLDQALGRVLSQDLTASTSVPPFNKSALDGYVVKAAETHNARSSSPMSFRVIEEVRAGVTPTREVTNGTSIKVMTGAPIPIGADVVIKFEDVTRVGDQVIISQPLNSGDNIILVGEDVTAGEIIARRGALINPPLVALAAGLGTNRLPVYERVKVAILSTGDELMNPSERLQPGKIYNSSLYGLAARCLELGAQPLELGIVPDEVEVTAASLYRGLENADIVVSTGGVSAGEYDVIKEAMLQIGAEMIFWKVAMKPGSPMVAAKKGNKLLIGLSGNPAAAMVTFDLVVVPILKKIMGMSKYLPNKIEGILVDGFTKASPQRRLLRAKLHREGEVDYVTLTGNQSNSVLKSMVECNVLVDVPAGSGPLAFGQRISGFIVGHTDEIY